MTGKPLEIQKFLAEAGLYEDILDGDLGPVSQAAIAAWLAKHPGNWRVGRATVFGLQYNGERDPMDNGLGAFGQDTANKTLLGVSLPVATLDDDLGLYAHRAAAIGIPHVEIHGASMVPSIASGIRSGKTQVKVVNAADVSITCRICDIGPGIRTGNSIDLTYAAAHALGTHGDAVVAFRVVAEVTLRS